MPKLTCFLLFVATLLFYNLSFANSCRAMVHNSQASTYAREVTVVIGTDRQGSKSAGVAAELVSQLTLDPTVRVNVVDLAQLPKSVFKSDYFAQKSKPFMENFVDPIDRASGLIFVIPEYDGAVPGILSYYMNHMRLSLLKKDVALVGVSAGKWGARAALDSFKGTLTHRGAVVQGFLQVNLEQVNDKFTGNTLTNVDSKARLAATATGLIKEVNVGSWGSVPSQKILALVAASTVNKQVKLELDNGVGVEGKLAKFILNENQTLAYVQFGGPTKIKFNDKVIEGQDVDVHNQGYGMPVGTTKNFEKNWYKKENLAKAKLVVGKRLKLEYESGVVVDGIVKKLTLDAEGNLQVITFTNVMANKQGELLFDKAWGDFDIAVGNHVEKFELIPN